MNSVVLIGNISSDITCRMTKNGTTVASFNVAVADDNLRDTTYFPRVTCFGKAADFCRDYLKKGRKVSIKGQITTSHYTNKNGDTIYETQVKADKVSAEDYKRPEADVEYQEDIKDPDTETPAESEEF